LYQALHGIYVPHSKEEHACLPQTLPTHAYYRNSTAESDFEPVEIPNGNGKLGNEYDPAHLMMAFPMLFPYAVGGFHDPHRSKPVSWEKQIAWQLLQSKRHFAQHEIYMFVVFNILQRRKISLGAKLMTHRSKLPAVAVLLQNFDYKEVRKRLSNDLENGSKHFFSDPILADLMRLTSVSNGLVKGSRDYIQRRRQEIRGLFVRYGTPKFFVTINPDDARHPLVFGLYTENEGRVSFEEPNEADFASYLQQRFKMISEDPVLQAEFFDIIMRAVLDVVFGFGAEDNVGILGEVAAHYFVLEAQGKGTLHAHGMVWLTDGMSTRSFAEANVDR
jgi:hypothetical protein